MPTSAEVDARVLDCRGRWGKRRSNRDELTVLARQWRDALMVTWHWDHGLMPHEIADRLGISGRTVAAVLSIWKPVATSKPVVAEPVWQAQPAGAAHAD
ncbi:MAG TPA: hypothetical protein VGL02_28545 [Streptomyces sp.]